MFDDRRRRAVELPDEVPRRIQIHDVIEGQLLALQLRRARERPRSRLRITIEGSPLVRILPVPDPGDLLECERQTLWERLIQRRKGAGDDGVIRRGTSEGRGRQHAPCPLRHAACLLHLGDDRCVLRRITDHGDSLPVLGRRAQQGHTADIDQLHGLGEGRIEGARFERVEIHHHQIDRGDAHLVQLGAMRGIVFAQDGRKDGRVQRLHATVQNRRISGDRLDCGHGNLRLAQRLGRSAGAEDSHAQLMQRGREIDDARLVPDADQRAADSDDTTWPRAWGLRLQ